MSGLEWVLKSQKVIFEKNKAISAIKLIISKVYNISYEEFLLENDINYNELDKYLIEYINSNKPIQYIVGFEYFMNKKFIVSSNTLIPRIETEEVVLRAYKIIINKFKLGDKLRILDLCCGTGIIGISLYFMLKDDYDVILTFSDIDKKCLEITRKNLDLYNIKANIICGDLLDEVLEKKIDIDVIVSNPPYIPYDAKLESSVVDYEPHLALFADNNGLELYFKIIDNIKSIINLSLVIFEIGDKQGTKIIKYANSKGFTNCKLYVDNFNRERIIIIEK